MSTVRVGFAHPESFCEQFVAWATAGRARDGPRFCHCELAVTTSTTSTATSGRQPTTMTNYTTTTWSSYWGEGVQKGSTADKWHRSRKWSWFTLAADAALGGVGGGGERERRMVRFLDSSVAKPYDYLGFLLWILPDALTPDAATTDGGGGDDEKHYHRQYFCSELCAEALERFQGLHLDGSTARKVSPNRLYALLQQQQRIVPDIGP
tara:strand:- start:52 stop:675 length:624 start_codon:yes stop_codon:yes gene_type:complete